MVLQNTNFEYLISIADHYVQDLVKLFTLFDVYPLQSQKRLDAEAFLQVLNLVLAKQHLTQEGLDKIKAIKSTMNRARMVQYKAH